MQSIYGIFRVYKLLHAFFILMKYSSYRMVESIVKMPGLQVGKTRLRRGSLPKSALWVIGTGKIQTREILICCKLSLSATLLHKPKDARTSCHGESQPAFLPKTDSNCVLVIVTEEPSWRVPKMRPVLKIETLPGFSRIKLCWCSLYVYSDCFLSISTVSLFCWIQCANCGGCGSLSKWGLQHWVGKLGQEDRQAKSVGTPSDFPQYFRNWVWLAWGAIVLLLSQVKMVFGQWHW